MNLSEIPIIVIAGPTGVGKTDLSIHLARKYRGEIINGDSMQVYRHLNIGTGKITEAEKQGIPHHLLDILEVDETYDAQQFKLAANEKILDIYQRGKLPIIVGGTGLYLEGLLYNLEFGHNQDDDSTIRIELEKRAEAIGELLLWEELEKLDPAAAEKIPYQNVRRTIRALEVIQKTGRKFSDQKAHKRQKSVYNDCLIILNRDRQELYERINCRVLKMLELGLEEEAESLYNKSQGQEWQSIKGIGYKEWWPYFEGQVSKEETIQQIQQNSRRYAKRQLTWFRNRMKSPQWINIKDESQSRLEAKQIISKHLANEMSEKE